MFLNPDENAALATPWESAMVESPPEEALLKQLEKQQQQLETLERSVAAQARTQFKTNALIQAQTQQTETLMDTLQGLTHQIEALSTRESPTDRGIARQREEARFAMLTQWLPILDGLESALSNSPSLMTPSQAPWGPLGRWLLESVQAKESARFKAWLSGLELVRERFLHILANEGVSATATVGDPFDPRLHVAVEAVCYHHLPNNSVARILTQGYASEHGVLRYAQVIVNCYSHNQEGRNG